MYQNKIYSLYLKKAKLIFKDIYGQVIPEESEVGDYAIPMFHNDSNSPDYYIRGYFRKVDHDRLNEFIIEPKGPQILFITGVPKEAPTLEPYRYKDINFTSYYEDTVKGCLFQVTSVKPIYISISKHNPIQL